MTVHNIRNLFIMIVATLVLAACGGSTSGNNDESGNSSGGSSGGGSTGGGNVTIDAGVNLIASSNNLPSNASTNAQGIQISAIVRDANNNVVQGQTVSFSADSGAIQVVQNITDESGTAGALLTTGGNPRNRTITVTASTGSSTDTVQIQVVGTQLSIAGPPALALGDTGTYTASLTDAGGSGIANRPVTVSSANGNTLSMSNPQTGSSGEAQFQLTANNPGSDVLTASALGQNATTQVEVAGDNFQLISPADGTQVALNTTQTVTLRWLNDGDAVDGEPITFSTTRGLIVGNAIVDTDANGEASITVQADNAGPATITAASESGLQTSTTLQFIATVPDSIDVQADPATLAPSGQSTITAILRDANNNLVTGQAVNFTLADSSGGSLRNANAVTNVNGVASTVYTAGSTSATQPASITATVNSDPGISRSVDVSIGGQALRITLGTGNDLMEPNSTTYRLPYVAIVTDANGVPAPDAKFRLSASSVSYQKGTRAYSEVAGTFIPVSLATPNGDPQDSFGCVNEDSNGNGVLDDGEDTNNNNRLEPGNIATVPATAQLDSNGIAEFDITYPQNFAQWVKIQVKAVASVQGTETTTDAVFVLPVLAADVDDSDDTPPNLISPFGTSMNCGDTK